MIISLQRENKIIKLCIKGVKEIYISKFKTTRIN